MAHYDVAGELRPHVRGQVEALAASVDTLLVCTTADLQDSARAWLTERAVLVAYYLGEMSVAEIAGTLGIPEGTVKTRLHRGRQALRKELSTP